MESLTVFCHYLNREIEISESKLNEASKSFNKDAFSFFQDSINLMEYAAKLKVCTRISQVLQHESVNNDLNKIYDFCLQETLRLAKWPSRSTSPTQNLMHQLETASIAEATDELKKIIKELI